jgi:urease subunit gamma/beta
LHHPAAASATLDSAERMRLLPRERDRLLIFLAAELARKRRDRGLRLAQAEAEAVIADAVCEAARDGESYEAVELAGYRALSERDVLEGVGRLVARVEVEPLFADGPRLIVLDSPILRDGPPPFEEAAVEWFARELSVGVTNRGPVTIGVTSHFHFFEVNRNLAFDRAQAWGMRLAVRAGVKVFFEPGVARDVWLAPIGGSRIVRGHGGLVSGPLDEPGARERAVELARERGYLGV